MGSLDNISVKGFKSIREMNLDLSSLNVLIGANGAGKSNFISLFTLLNRIVSNQLQVFVAKSGGADTLLYFGHAHTEQIKIFLKFGANGYKAVLTSTESDSLIFEREQCTFLNSSRYANPYVESLGEGHSETKLTEAAPNRKVPRYVYSAMMGWKVYHFHDTSDSAKVRKSGDINDNHHLRADAANLAAFLNRLRIQYPTHYEIVVKTIRMVAPFFEDFILRPNPLNEETIRLEWREVNSDAYMNAMALSDGTLRFICLTTLLLQPTQLQPSTIVIDEPELGLHPFAISLLSSLIKKVSSQRQVIVSTQSVPLVNQFDPEDLIIVDREDGQSVFKRVEPKKLESWMGEYSLGELWEKNLLGGRPNK
jgi:predicted ATPase